jgi:cysteine desulfurase
MRAGGRFAPDQVRKLPVDGQGVLDLEALERALASCDRADGLPLVAVHAANNETGVLQPLGAIARATKAAGGVLVVDAVQAAGRIPLDITDGCGDFLILSSHKIGGPKGAGALVGAGSLLAPAALMTGGAQERGRRAGTEDVAAIAGFGAAARAARERLALAPRIGAVRDRFEAAILELAPGATIYGGAAARLCNTVFFSLPGLKAETAQIAFDLAGVALSAGSACSSGKVGPSHVLEAMGRGSGEGALRVSIGAETGDEELELFRAALARIAARGARSREAA